MEKKSVKLQWKLVLLFPVVLFYYETVFRLSTGGHFFRLGTLFMLLLCFVYGGFGYLLCTLFKNRKSNQICVGIYIFLSSLPFLIEYFINRQFKIFYDLNTIVNGAGGALTSYSHEIVRMVFSWSGLWRIFLFFLPSIAYVTIVRFFVTTRRSNARKRILIAVLMAIILLFSVLGISLSPTLRQMCGSQYNFQTVVGNLGLLTGLNLDIRAAIFGSGQSGSFETDATIPEIPVPSTAPSDGSEATEDTEPPVVYTPNQMDIDFASLSATGQISELNAYVASQTASMKNAYTGMFAGKNLVLITAEAFAFEVIDPELTPTLYRLATKGMQFTDFYQPSIAGTTGGEYQNLFGMLPTAGGKSFTNTANHNNYFTMGSILNREGYFGMAFHNNSYTYYHRNETHINLGYSNGFMGMGNGMEAYVQKSWPQSDLEMFAGTIPLYIDRQPFNVYYMTVSGHSNYSVTGNSMSRKNYSRVANLNYSEAVKCYIAAQLELEDALTTLVEALEAAGIADDTVICMAADHFPYGLDDDASLGNMPYLSELYGYNVTTSFQRDHSGLILWCGSLEDSEPIVVSSPTSSLDILPTLANLFGAEFDSRLLPGRDVFSDAAALYFTTSYDWKTEYGTYYASSNKFVPTDPSITLPDGYVDAVKSVVRNKIRYCQGVLDTDYFGYLFKQGCFE